MQVKTIPVTPFAQNCRVIICEETNFAAIVDPGGDKDKIVMAIEQLGVKVQYILLTHAHLDHVGASEDLSEHFDVDILGPHQDDEFWLEGLSMQAQMFGFPPHSPFRPAKWLTHLETLNVGSLVLEIRHCPGHTPGHIVFYESKSRQVLVGDVLFKGSVGRTDFPKGDSEQLKQSIEAQLFTLPGDTKVLSGHGEDTTIEWEQKTNPFMSGRFG